LAIVDDNGEIRVQIVVGKNDVRVFTLAELECIIAAVPQ
jgi:hypothetical protein